MNKRIVVIVSDMEFSINKSKKATLKEWGMFVVFALVIYSLVFFVYFYLRKHILPEHFVMLSILLFVITFLLNRKHLKMHLIRICRINDEFHFEDKSVFGRNEEKKVIIYEYAGETLVDAIGNIYLRIGKKDYSLLYSATENEINEIIAKLEVFFSERLIVERKALY